MKRRPSVPPSGTARQRGTSLLEVLVSIMLLSIGLLGLAALQAGGLRNNQSAMQRASAVVLSYSIIDAMRSNLTVARNGGYTMTLAQCAAAGSAGSGLALSDLANWVASLRTNLGDNTACGQVALVGGIHVVTVQWNDARGTAGQNPQQLVTRVLL